MNQSTPEQPAKKSGAVSLIRSLAHDIWHGHYPEIIPVEQIEFMLGWMYAAEEIERQFGKVEIISASNCFAHIEDIADVTKGINSLLAPDGTAVIEVHWLGSLIENNQFPFIYHEHMYYYSLKSLRYLLNQHGLEVFDVKHIPIHGGSIRFYCCHAGQHVPFETVAELRNLEETMGLYRCETFENYGSKVRKAAEATPL